METKPKTLFQNIRGKLIGYIIAAIVVHTIVKTMGFPAAFVKASHIFTFAGFLFFILIDLPPMKEQKGIRGVRNLFFTFVLLSGAFTTAGWMHPQYNQEVEIAKINKPPLSLEDAAGPEAIAAGKEIFTDNKCFNCHKAAGEGSSDRGPHFDLIQVGLSPKEEIRENIVDPRKATSKGFEDDKSKKEMPTYYGEDLSKAKLNAVTAFLQSLWNDKNMPVRGKAGELIQWDEDTEMIALGKKAFEGELYDDLNCSVCHGIDGIPLMEGAADLRDPSHVSKVSKKPLKEWTDADWFLSVSKGVSDTPMAAWGDTYPPKAIWLAIAYAKQFHKKGIS